MQRIRAIGADDLRERQVCGASSAARTPKSGICEQTKKTNSVTAVHVSLELNGTLRSGELVDSEQGASSRRADARDLRQDGQERLDQAQSSARAISGESGLEKERA